MTAKDTTGKLLAGDTETVRRSWDAWNAQPIDQEMMEGSPYPERQTSIGKAVSVTGPGTFRCKDECTLHFVPTSKDGWVFDRIDQPEQMPIRVSVSEVWTTARNIVLSSGSPHNYMRMVEHIVALKVGMGVDNMMICMESGDPPLFERSSMDLVEAFDEAGLVEQNRPATYVTVKEPVTMAGPYGSFLTFLPAERGTQTLDIDCAVDFQSAIGRQRIRFRVSPESFRYGAAARTNCTLGQMVYCKTLGKLFADTRNLGYTTRNILIAGRRRYFNKPGVFHNGKSLEAAWHRATLDLLAAVALIDKGRFAGKIISYKAGHSLDVQAIREIYKQDLLERVQV
jgi:UDP-3-O-[3-hydroxymyristoyl] N-acetylglucosamine deacetylase